MSKINIDTDILLKDLEAISRSLKKLNTVARRMQKSSMSNSKYDLIPLVKYRDLSQTIGSSIESYVLCTERDINTMMKQVGMVEEVDRNIADKNKLDFKP